MFVYIWIDLLHIPNLILGAVMVWSYGSLIYNYLCNQCISPLTLWVRNPLRRVVLDTTLCDKVCHIARNDRWFAYLHIQNGGSKRIWNLTYSWTGNFLLVWAGQFSGIENQTMHRFEQYLKILQLFHENSRFPPSFKFWSVSTIQKHWEEVKKCILHGFQDIKALFLQSPF